MQIFKTYQYMDAETRDFLYLMYNLIGNCPVRVLARHMFLFVNARIEVRMNRP
jgi:hypothetical protein